MASVGSRMLPTAYSIVWPMGNLAAEMSPYR